MNPRLDELLVCRGLFTTLHDATAAILAGEVIVGEHRETCAGKRVAPDALVRLKADTKSGFVSRGGIKLDHALDEFDIDVEGRRCVDLGCSTGGFTDCLLKRGAAHVTAIDVGFGQFDWGLRNDERVTLFERTNVRGIDVESVGGPFELAVADLSFISLRTVFHNVADLLEVHGIFISLVKPQFELLPDQVPHGGVVRDERARRRALESVLCASTAYGLIPQDTTVSPITGRDGNVEFFYWAIAD